MNEYTGLTFLGCLNVDLEKLAKMYSRNPEKHKSKQKWAMEGTKILKQKILNKKFLGIQIPQKETYKTQEELSDILLDLKLTTSTDVVRSYVELLENKELKYEDTLLQEKFLSFKPSTKDNGEKTYKIHVLKKNI